MRLPSDAVVQRRDQLASLLMRYAPVALPLMILQGLQRATCRKCACNGLQIGKQFASSLPETKVGGAMAVSE